MANLMIYKQERKTRSFCIVHEPYSSYINSDVDINERMPPRCPQG